MIKKRSNFITILKREYLNDKRSYLTLGVLLFICFILRVWRLDQLLGFYYDQGRDAQVIWDFWHNHKFFLIGPTTGIEGIYRGPWYYWLIAPFYLLGRGNPVWPSVFLSVTTVAAAFMAFIIGNKINGKATGIIAVILFTFSFNLIQASRWLSNPTPMLLISMLLLFSLFQIMEGKKLFWIGVGALLGLAMQFGSAAEVFYFFAVGIFAVLQRKNLPSLTIAMISLGALFAIFIPQILFDFKHDHVLWDAIKKFLIVKQSFKASFWEMVQIRFSFYYDVFFSKLFVTNVQWRMYFAILTIFLFFLSRTLLNNRFFNVIILLLLAPIIGMLFFQGNSGNVYDYYFTGYYLIFIIFIACILGNLAKSTIGRAFVAILILWFLFDNVPLTKSYLSDGADGPTHITLGNAVQAVDWAINDSNLRAFNTDSYVPPVIPFSYHYLYLWRTTEKCGASLCNLKLDSQVPLLYTLYEVDPPHPERLDAWLARQQGIGRIEETKTFGGVTVQRRIRF